MPKVIATIVRKSQRASLIAGIQRIQISHVDILNLLRYILVNDAGVSRRKAQVFNVDHYQS